MNEPQKLNYDSSFYLAIRKENVKQCINCLSISVMQEDYGNPVCRKCKYRGVENCREHARIGAANAVLDIPSFILTEKALRQCKNGGGECCEDCFLKNSTDCQSVLIRNLIQFLNQGY